MIFKIDNLQISTWGDIILNSKIILLPRKQVIEAFFEGEYVGNIKAEQFITCNEFITKNKIFVFYVSRKLGLYPSLIEINSEKIGGY